MAIAIDGSAQGSTTSGLTATVTLSTSQSNDIIVLSIVGNTAGTVTTITDTAGLTWISRATDLSSGSGFPLFEYYAVSPSPLTNDVIVVTFSLGTTFSVVTAFGISGANTSTIFDSNVSLPVTGDPDPLTYSTSNANDLIIAHFGSSVANPTSGAGWTQIVGANFQLVEYKIVSTTQSAQSATVGTGVGQSDRGIVDAFISSAAADVLQAQIWM